LISHEVVPPAQDNAVLKQREIIYDRYYFMV